MPRPAYMAAHSPARPRPTMISSNSSVRLIGSPSTGSSDIERSGVPAAKTHLAMRRPGPTEGRAPNRYTARRGDSPPLPLPAAYDLPLALVPLLRDGRAAPG